MVNRALEHMRRSFAALSERKTSAVLLPFISRPADTTALSDAARRLGISINALQVRLSRFRAAFAKHVREELAPTASSPDEIEPEIRYLLDVSRPLANRPAAASRRLCFGLLPPRGRRNCAGGRAL